MDGGPSRPRECDSDSVREWPFNGDFSDAFSPARADSGASRSSLRFLVLQSPVLPPRRKIAVLDVHDEVQVGRDAPTSESTPRLRLKDMEVSKLHATVFWDKDRDEWAVVDMGSKHGTFLRSTSSSGTAIETRLSGSRTASMPRPLRHLDQLSFGRTAFAVHIHSNGLPCEDCSPPDEFSSIPLASKSGFSHLDTQPETTSTPMANAAAPASSTSAREALGSLKRRLLSEHAIPDPKRLKADEGRTRYVDRSSLRRALHPSARDPISLPVPAARPSVIHSSTHALTVARYHNQGATTATITADFAPSDSSFAQVPAAISKSNVGHRLLEKQGWSPGAPLGNASPSDLEPDPANARTALLEPLQVTANAGKRGLGSTLRTHP